MRKITNSAVTAFFNNMQYKSGNTMVSGLREGRTINMYLHGNLIATRSGDTVKLYDCGWQTTTTKERLNGILDRLNLPRIYQSKHVWYTGDEKWVSGHTIEVGTI